MNLKIVSNFIRSAWISILWVFHSIGGKLGLWNHYTLYGNNAGGGFAVRYKTKLLMTVNVGGYNTMVFRDTFEVSDGHWEIAKLHSTYDWPSHILGEYKPWKMTFNNK